MSEKRVQVSDGYARFFCEGCGGPHIIALQKHHADEPVWGWNGDEHKPVFTPSVLLTWDEPANLYDKEKMAADVKAKRDHDVPIPLAAKVCHTFIGCNGAQPGQIVFLGDSTHKHSGTVRDLPAYDEAYRKWSLD